MFSYNAANRPQSKTTRHQSDVRQRCLVEFAAAPGAKSESLGHRMVLLRDDVLGCSDIARTPCCDGQTDGRTQGHAALAYIASRGKNRLYIAKNNAYSMCMCTCDFWIKLT